MQINLQDSPLFTHIHKLIHLLVFDELDVGTSEQFPRFMRILRNNGVIVFQPYFVFRQDWFSWPPAACAFLPLSAIATTRRDQSVISLPKTLSSSASFNFPKSQTHLQTSSGF